MAHTSHHGGTSGHEPNSLGHLGYETRDIEVKTLAGWLSGGLVVFIGLASFVVYGLYQVFVPTYAEMEKPSPLKYVRTLPPNPQIQPRPQRDIIGYWAHENALLKGAAPGENGAANLPIEQAMDQLAQRGISGVTGDQLASVDTNEYPGSGYHPASAASPQGPVGDFGGVDGNFEGNAYPNPFAERPAPPPYPTWPAPGSTAIGGAGSAVTTDSAAAPSAP